MFEIVKIHQCLVFFNLGIAITKGYCQIGQCFDKRGCFVHISQKLLGRNVKIFIPELFNFRFNTVPPGLEILFNIFIQTFDRGHFGINDSGKRRL
ncbi:hypothetical protein SDC9_93628 [bioreactor metagenome]|uniref:Uncharacterized protein n=1 Tax=bioreactor metagenome TaxID=1076179 RepID=A0A645A3T4_9ZZZZ